MNKNAHAIPLLKVFEVVLGDFLQKAPKRVLNDLRAIPYGELRHL